MTGRNLSDPVYGFDEAKSRIADWQAEHPEDPLLPAVAWLLAEVERYRAYPPEGLYRVELISGEVKYIKANFANVPMGYSFSEQEGVSLGIVGRGSVAWFHPGQVKSAYPVEPVPEWVKALG